MLKASQLSLAQQANMGVVNNRNAEITYYTSFMNNFGNQAAIIGGFAYQNLTQVSFPVIADPYPTVYYNFSKSMYFISCAVCMAASMHVIICSTLLQIMGPGLALYGPKGSMAQSADKMKSEIMQVVWAHVIMMLSFAASMVFLFWVKMSVISAALSTALFIGAAPIWWYYCFRTYNKFYLENIIEVGISKDWWGTGIAEADGSTEKGWFARARGKEYENENGSKRPKRQLFGLRKSPSTGTATFNKHDGSPGIDCEKSVTMNPLHKDSRATRGDEEVMKGYMLQKSRVKLIWSKEKWSRQYFVLTANGNLFTYASKQDYIERPHQHVTGRPLEVSNYVITYGKCEMIFEWKDKDEQVKPWEFRVDTEEELDVWKTALDHVVAANNSTPSTGFVREIH